MDLSPLLRVQSRRPAPPRRRSKKTRDRVAKQEALIRAATKLFASKGYEATTTREIAATAGCAEGLIHRYFNGKSGLLPALVEDLMSEEVADIGATLPAASTLEEEFLQLISWEIDRAWQKRD